MTSEQICIVGRDDGRRCGDCIPRLELQVVLRHSARGATVHFNAVLCGAAFNIVIETNVGAQRAWQVQTAPRGTAAHAALG